MKRCLLVLLTIFSVTTYGQNNWNIISGKINPEEAAGVKHNQVVDLFIKSEVFLDYKKGKEKNPAQLLLKFSNFCCNSGKSYCCIFEDQFPNQLSIEKLSKLLQNRPSTLSIATKLGANKSVLFYFNKIEDLLKGLPTKSITNRADYQQFFELEKSIINDTNLNNEDKKKVLMMAAVSRYSSHYWSWFQNSEYNIDSWVPDWGRAGVVDTIGAIGGPECAGVCSLIDLIYQYNGK